VLSAYAKGRVFGERHGTGTPGVLALHGWGRSHRDFSAVLGQVGSAGDPFDGRAIDALAVDLPGFGAAPPPPAVWGTADYADFLLPLLDEIEGRVVVCGHSFGGLVAAQLAARHPDRLSGLVLTGAPLLRPGGQRRRPPLRYRVVRRLAELGLLGEDRLEASRRRHGSRDYREATGIMRQVLVRRLQESYDDLLDRIDLPVELVWGDRDTAAPVSTAYALASRLRRAHLVVLEGVGHLVPTSAPAALREAIARLTT
jgi:pimeloyl-ACP methyl ester carboxylesterase